MATSQAQMQSLLMVSTAQKESSGAGEMAPSVNCWPQTEVSFSDCAGEAVTAAPGSSEAAQL